MKSVKKLNIIDLFSGCGGLSIGFESFEGRFRTVMALDNWKPAVTVYNNNRKFNNSKGIARLCDLNFFRHEVEILLYYLSHLDYINYDDKVHDDLVRIQYFDFLASIKETDDLFKSVSQVLLKSDTFLEDLSQIDSSVTSLAFVKGIFYKLNIANLKKLSVDESSLIWSNEYKQFNISVLSKSKFTFTKKTFSSYRKIVSAEWENILSAIQQSMQGEGRGQHSDNPLRVRKLNSFFNSNTGIKFRDAWIEWQTTRRSLSEDYCLKINNEILQLYSLDRKVSGILGGPPCKGFSRIGRAVIRELRSQGAHAWASADFGDERNALMYKYILFVSALRPDFFVFENVAQFASSLDTPSGEFDGAKALIEAINEIIENGQRYNFSEKIFKAKEYSIPQARERFILVATKSDSESIVNSIQASKETVPLIHALIGLSDPHKFQFGDLEFSADTSLKTECYTLIDPREPQAVIEYKQFIRNKDPNTGLIPEETDAHVYRVPREDDQRLIEYLPSEMRWMDLKISEAASKIVLSDYTNDDVSDKNLLLKCILNEISCKIGTKHHLLENGYLKNGNNHHGDWLQRLSANRPSNTIVAHIGKDTYGYIHPFADRPITIREAARIQTFPDWFSFANVGIVDAYSMIGNAVPPLLSKKIASAILEQL